ncbi:helix-turn-helix transcriptional regulator [uncultured Aquimarina sp.]|uniref:helix-turn-helix domain-containing protein n=1 Tax=uncultured Aquimarina sp. TaxID=575652 RepID=UPI00262B09D9|nr:helix-turn-helix transcriptional regulator [uncultured Aquimarina sp.]
MKFKTDLLDKREFILTMIGNKLKKIRTKKGLTQTELSEISGVSYIQIGRYENNISKPTSKIIKKLADALEIPTDHFFESNEEFVKIKDIDSLYQKMRDLVSDDQSEVLTIKKMFEAIIFKNEARRRFQ